MGRRKKRKRRDGSRAERNREAALDDGDGDRGSVLAIEEDLVRQLRRQRMEDAAEKEEKEKLKLEKAARADKARGVKGLRRGRAIRAHSGLSLPGYVLSRRSLGGRAGVVPESLCVLASLRSASFHTTAAAPSASGVTRPFWPSNIQEAIPRPALVAQASEEAALLYGGVEGVAGEMDAVFTRTEGGTLTAQRTHGTLMVRSVAANRPGSVVAGSIFCKSFAGFYVVQRQEGEGRGLLLPLSNSGLCVEGLDFSPCNAPPTVALCVNERGGGGMPYKASFASGPSTVKALKFCNSSSLPASFRSEVLCCKWRNENSVVYGHRSGAISLVDSRGGGGISLRQGLSGSSRISAASNSSGSCNSAFASPGGFQGDNYVLAGFSLGGGMLFDVRRRGVCCRFDIQEPLLSDNKRFSLMKNCSGICASSDLATICKPYVTLNGPGRAQMRLAIWSRRHAGVTDAIMLGQNSSATLLWEGDPCHRRMMRSHIASNSSFTANLCTRFVISVNETVKTLHIPTIP